MLQRLNGRRISLSRFLVQWETSVCCSLNYSRELEIMVFYGQMSVRLHSSSSRHLTSPPLLSKPILGEILYLYLAVWPHAISSVLVCEEAGGQRSIYYINKILSDIERCYLPANNIALALIFLARKLHPYF